MGGNDFNLYYWKKRFAKHGAIKTVCRPFQTVKDYNADRDDILKKASDLVGDKKAVVLDFGCGNGRFYPFLSKAFGGYVGVDLLQEMIYEARETHNPSHGVFVRLQKWLEKPELHEGRYGTIWTCKVLQHVVSDDLLNMYLNRFEKDTTPKAKMVFVENTSRPSSGKAHMAFRTVRQYQEIVEKTGFEFKFDRALDKYHSIMFFAKR